MHKARGFTVVELMVTLLLAAIVAGLAVPSLNFLVRNNRAASIANELVSSIRLARSEAVIRSQQVTLCPSTDGNTCAVTTNWSNGWIIRDATSLIRVYPPITQISDGSTLTGSRNSLVFQATGFQTGTDFTFNLNVPKCTMDNNRSVVVTPQGRPGVVKVAC
jgi:type IV fimbrial biogenesis protein FimT